MAIAGDAAPRNAQGIPTIRPLQHNSTLPSNILQNLPTIPTVAVTSNTTSNTIAHPQHSRIDAQNVPTAMPVHQNSALPQGSVLQPALVPTSSIE